MRILWLLALAASGFAQTNNYPYFLKTFAGAFRVGDGRAADVALLGDGGPATSALLYYPMAAVPDLAGNLFILDQDNLRIRKVAPDGRIATFAQIYCYGNDMKLAADGSLYVGAFGRVIKVSPAGVTSLIAGIGVNGYAGDGGMATSAQVDAVFGVALDGAGNVYFTDVSPPGARVRMVSTDGKIRTIAGTRVSGFDGDNQLASTASFTSPLGIAVDAAGNIYVADGPRIRRFTVGGKISTIAGTGVVGQPANGPATATPLGNISGLSLDPSGNLYATDTSYGIVIKITPSGALTRVAGTYSRYGSPGDGIATGVSLLNPDNVTWTSSGTLYITDETHVVRRLTPDGNMTTVAGRVHFSGDNGPAVNALLNEPTDVALDGQGNVFIADARNFRIRKVAADGTITTYSGTGVPGFPQNGASAGKSQLPYLYAIAADSKGALYLASYSRIFKIAPDGIVTTLAGTGIAGNTGDGGPATSATIEGATSVAVDSAGNVYFADMNANRVRKIAAGTGIISAFAGTGTMGFGGDGGLATSALLDLTGFTSLAADSKGNVYIADGYNYRVRMVTPVGIISTVVGNGTFGRPDGVQASTASFSVPAGVAVDSADNLYVTSDTYGDMYRVSGGIIRRILGDGPGYWIDGTPALGTNSFIFGLKVDQNGDVYAADCCGNTVFKFMVNTPTGLTIADGNRQTAQTGQSLSKALKVQLNGRAGSGVSGVPVNFAVTSGSATLSAQTTQTDPSGIAGIGVTMGAVAGDVTVAATAVGTGLSAVAFTETATVPCGVPQPAITSVNSAGDFGGGKTFAPGSWLEIKGTNLAQSTRPWGGEDFNGTTAPTSLDGVVVTIHGNKAYVGYVSPGQINVQAPGDTATGDVQLTVSTSACSTGTMTVTEAAMAPGLLAPASFRINGTQYLAATFPDGFTFVGNANLIPGVPFRPAAPGENITAYGTGFGPVSPAIAPGVIAAGTSSIANLTISFGGTPAQVTYGGLAPGAVGLYQFNFVVPDVPDGDYLVAFQVGPAKVAQNVYLTVRRTPGA